MTRQKARPGARCTIGLTNTSDAPMGITVPRRDGPRLLIVPPGESADVDVTELVWPERPDDPEREPERPRVQPLDLLVAALALPGIAFAGYAARAWEPMVGVSLGLWVGLVAGPSLVAVWRACR